MFSVKTSFMDSELPNGWSSGSPEAKLQLHSAGVCGEDGAAAGEGSMETVFLGVSHQMHQGVATMTAT